MFVLNVSLRLINEIEGSIIRLDDRLLHKSLSLIIISTYKVSILPKRQYGIDGEE